MARQKQDPGSPPEETVIAPPKETGGKGRKGRGLDDDFSQAEIRRKLTIGLNGLARALGSDREHGEKDFAEVAEALEDLVNHLPFPGKPLLRVGFSALSILDLVGKVFTIVTTRSRFRETGQRAAPPSTEQTEQVTSANGGFHSPFGGFGR